MKRPVCILKATSPVTSRNSDASQQRFPEQHVGTKQRIEQHVERIRDLTCLINVKQVFKTKSLLLNCESECRREDSVLFRDLPFGLGLF